MRAIYALADRLHKTITEIQEMPVEEFLGWIAYYKLEEKKENGNKQ